MNKITLIIQIGNSDDKLTQKEWADFCNNINFTVLKFGDVHFTGGSKWDAQWQNACWIFNAYKEDIPDIKSLLKMDRERYRQDSIALTIGETQFI